LSKSRSRREYLILTDNIIVLDHILNLTKKSNLIGRLYYDLTQCFDNLGVAYFLGHPVYCVGWGVKLFSLICSLALAVVLLWFDLDVWGPFSS